MLILVLAPLALLPCVSARGVTVRDRYSAPWPPLPRATPYPITAAFFASRDSVEQWSTALSNFSKIGGDTVVTRAPALTVTSAAKLAVDPRFKGCKSSSRNESCVDEATSELHDVHGLNLTFATYENQDNFSEKMVVCDKFDKRFIVNKTSVVYRLVIQLHNHRYWTRGSL